MGYQESHLTCQECGYDMRGRKGGDRCPECGKMFDDRHAVPHANKKSRNAIIWLVVSIISMPFIGIFSLFPFVIGSMYSLKILRKSYYNRVPYHLAKRLKTISVLMWCYGFEMIALIAINFILLF